MIERKSPKREGAGGRAVHDVGGLDLGPIDRSEHELSYYEERVDALVMLLAGHQIFRVDALRRAVEDYAQQEYDGTPYYDRWIRAIRNLLIEQEVLSKEEIEARIDEICARLQAEGQTVDRSPVP